VPLVFWAHAAPSSGNWIERIARRHRPALVIANSQHTLAQVGSFFHAVPARILHCPVAPPDPSSLVKSRSLIRQELGTPKSAVVIIMVARIEQGKGHQSLLDGLSRLRQDRSWECWFVGGVQRREEQALFETLVHAGEQSPVSSRIRWITQRTNVPALLSAADIYCQPNTSPESFGITFVEALYAGLPVVTTGMGGALEIVDSSCGRLVPPRDPVALAATLSELIEDAELRSRLGAAGPIRAAQLCSPENQLPRLHELLKSVATRRTI
jgi:glycosyltransferase involved in cell wall biosynthesis